MVKKRHPIVAGGLILFLFANYGCMVSFNQKIPTTSTPAGVDVYVADEFVGKTPLTLELDRTKGHEVRLSAEGYTPVIIEVVAHKPHAALRASLGLVNGFLGFLGALALTVALFGYGPDSGGAEFIMLPVMAIGFTSLYFAGTEAGSKLTPDTIEVKPEKEGEVSPTVIQLDEEQLKQIRWIRVTAK